MGVRDRPLPRLWLEAVAPSNAGPRATVDSARRVVGAAQGAPDAWAATVERMAKGTTEGRRRRWRAIRSLGSAVLGAWLLSVLAVVVWGARDSARRADAIVVLGAAQYAGRPSPVLRARVDHAVSLWKQDLATWFIVTGGTGAGDTTSEAAVAKRYAVRQGVPERAILMESQGRTTEASVEAVAVIMRRRDLKHAILVSDPFHMLRLAILSRRYGLHTAPSPTRTSPISSSPLQSVSYIVSESIKVPATLVLQLVGR